MQTMSIGMMRAKKLICIKNNEILMDYNHFLNEALVKDLVVGMKVIFINNIKDKSNYDKELKVDGLTATYVGTTKKIANNWYGYLYYIFDLDQQIGNLKTIQLIATQLRCVQILGGEIKKLDGLVKVKATADFRKILSRIKFKIVENYLDITNLSYDPNDTDYIYYMPANKAHFKDDKYKIKSRVGRILAKLNPILSQQEIEKFVNLFRAEVQSINDPPRIEVVTGDAITHWYSSSRYEKGVSTLNNSCMKNSNTVEFYAQFPEKIALAIYVKNGNLWGRALIWNCDNGVIYMDRIYSVNTEAQIQISKFAEKHGMEMYPRGVGSRTVTLKRGFRWAKSRRDYPYFDSARFPQNYSRILLNATAEDDLILKV